MATDAAITNIAIADLFVFIIGKPPSVLFKNFDDFTISIIVLLIFITIIQIYIKIVLFYCNFRRVLKESYYPLPSSLAFRYVLKACSIASPLLFAEYAVHFFSLIPLVSLYMVTNKRIFLQSNY